jgi:O-antigen ligase
VATVVFGLLQHGLFDSARTFFPTLYNERDIPAMEQWHNAGRITANWVHPSNFGSIINLTAPLALYYYLESETLQLRYLIVYGLLGVGVLMTGTRTPIVAFAVSAILLMVILRRRMSRLILPLAAFALIAIATLPFVFSSLVRFQMDDPENQVTVASRAVTGLEALLLFIHNPVLGVGSRNYQDRVVFDELGAQYAAHNVFIQEAAETGVVGITCLMILLYAAFRDDFRGPQSRSPELRALSWALFVGCVAILIECLAQNSLYVWQIWCLFWLYRGIAAAIRTRPEAFRSPVSAG